MFKKVVSLFTIVSVFFVACDRGEFAGYDKTDSGLLYKIHIDKDGPKAIPGDFISVEMSYKTNEDSLIFDAEGETFPLELVAPVFAGDINEALALLGEGDSATFVIRADSFLILNAKIPKNQLPKFVDDNSRLIFDIKLHSIQTLAELEEIERDRVQAAMDKEDEIITNYIKEHNIATSPEESGMYYILEKSGNGKAAKSGSNVTVHYTGRFLDGTKFDSSYDRNKPIEFQLGAGMVISGWDQGIAMMKVGDEATFIIPSYLGYGSGRGQIPPYTPLLFDVKLIDVK
ncbi:MAG: hypothetical protein B7C24_00600 [Bacteroidetes bacterium 4572_77]|nr:MAG: hypothetical protein B7C24_00600 [Bacteroidetes bacterium 4572_77]